MQRKQVWQAEGEEEALPLPTTFLRAADDSGEGDATGVRESFFRTDVEEVNIEDTVAADGDEQDGGAEERASWVRGGDRLIDSDVEFGSKPLARGLYNKLFAGKRREAQFKH